MQVGPLLAGRWLRLGLNGLGLAPAVGSGAQLGSSAGLRRLCSRGARPRAAAPRRPGHGGAFIPRKCPNSGAANPGIPGSECPMDSLAPLPERSAYVDQQSLKLQVRAALLPGGWLALAGTGASWRWLPGAGCRAAWCWLAGCQ